MIRRRRYTAIRILKVRAGSHGSASFMGSNRPFVGSDDMRKKVASEALKASPTEKKGAVLPPRQSIKKAAPAANKNSGTGVTGSQVANSGGKTLATPKAGNSGESELLRNWQAPLQEPLQGN